MRPVGLEPFALGALCPGALPPVLSVVAHPRRCGLGQVGAALRRLRSLHAMEAELRERYPEVHELGSGPFGTLGSGSFGTL